MEQTTLKELRRLVKIGAAEEITECKQITESVKQISYSSGIYGLNGAFVVKNQTGYTLLLGVHLLSFTIAKNGYVRFVSCIATLTN